MNNKVIILIPSYEPDEKLVSLVDNLSKEDMDVIIVDDGSVKNYKDIFTSCKEYAKVISYKENKGKGHALKTGLKYIKDNFKEPYIVVTMDSDGQHTIKDAKKIIKELLKSRKGLILGKRIRNEKTPLRSKIGNSITKFVYKITTGLDVYDTQTGLRAFSDDLIDLLLEIEGNRFEYEMNVLLKCAIEGIKIKEIEISTIYLDNNSGTHFNAIKDSYRIYKDIIKNVVKYKKRKK